MNAIKEQIYTTLAEMRARNAAAQAALTKRCSVADYRHLVRRAETEDGSLAVWTDALQAALDENEIVVLPPSSEPYYVDRSLLVPSNRRIEAAGATVRQMKGVCVLMLRNVHTANGTHAPIPADSVRDANIAICGGRFEESMTGRAGYGSTGRYDEAHSFFGVSTCMLFNNMTGLTLKDVTFAHTGGFSVQMGDIADVDVDSITFDECYADGLHINGNSENLSLTNISGQVGDDLVALNMYDWQNSSVNFGPMRNVLCEHLTLSPGSPYQAMRIEPGIYIYDDGSTVDCGLYNAIIKDVTGIRTFKLYYQTPAYSIAGGEPEKGGPGSGDYIFFENIKVDLHAPIDAFREYLESDPVRGTFAAFELGSNLRHVSFENIDLTLYPEAYPMSCLCCVGPKSVCFTAKGDLIEAFDPYVSSSVEEISFENIRINGETPEDIAPYLREIAFDNINGDGRSTARGAFGTVIYHK